MHALEAALLYFFMALIPANNSITQCDCLKSNFIEYEVLNDEEAKGQRNLWRVVDTELAYDIRLRDEPQRCFVQLEPEDSSVLGKLIPSILLGRKIHFVDSWMSTKEFKRMMAETNCFTMM